MSTSKNVWYLHHYAGAPSIGMSYRPYYLAKHLNQQGVNTSVIAANFHHLLTKKTLQKAKVRYETIDTINYAWLKTWRYHGQGIRRLGNMFSYAIRLFTQQKQLVAHLGKPDVIIVSSTHPFHYLTARKIAKKYHAKLIFEVRDLWPLSIIELLGVNTKHPLIRLMSHIEKKAYQEADYVVSLLSNALTYMAPLGLDAARYCYIPNGVDILTNESVTILPNTLQQKIDFFKKQHKFIVVYTGAHGIPNALEQFIDAFNILEQQQEDNICAILVGDGAEKENLQDKAKHLNNVFFHDSILKTAIPHLLSQVDACFLGWRNSKLYTYGVSPNKVFDYMLSGKPIIQAINSPNDPVAQAKCGAIVPAEQPNELAKTLISLSMMDASTLTTLGKCGKDYVTKQHSYEFLARKYAKLF